MLFWYSHCGWLFVNGRQTLREKYTRGLRDDRLIIWQDRLYVPIVLSGLADWTHYRYKKYETTVPVRNIAWQAMQQPVQNSGC